MLLNHRNTRGSYKKHPRTPDPYEKQSKRTFDGRIKAWRRILHQWDPARTVPVPAPVHVEQNEMKDIEVDNTNLIPPINDFVVQVPKSIVNVNINSNRNGNDINCTHHEDRVEIHTEDNIIDNLITEQQQVEVSNDVDDDDNDVL